MSVVEDAATGVDADEQRVAQLVDELLAEHDPGSTTEREFLEAQFDKGLAWVHFPEGHGGLGLSPKLQKTVVERIGRAHGPTGGAKTPTG